MKPITKTLIGTAAIGAMTLAGAAPAVAADRYRDRDGIDAGDVIAGALIIGGIAAVAGAFDDDDNYRYRDRYDNRRYNDRYYNRRSARSAVEQCVRIAERQAYRAGYRRVKVTDIRDVDRKSYGYKIKGRIAVDNGYLGGRYGRGWGGDYRGWNRSMNGWDSGKFSCKIDRRGVRDLDYSGIRGLR